MKYKILQIYVNMDAKNNGYNDGRRFNPNSKLSVAV